MIDMLKSTIQKERDALDKLCDFVGVEHEKTVKALLECNGKVIFAGVGKSGHIGKKLAATFASTGTPSFFLHACEAVHGDLGMIESKDFIILITNSGSTQEVVNLIPTLKNIGCKTVAFTSNPDSVLAKNCDYKLLFPKVAEADNLNLAPTCSSTLTLALGDAVACALSAAKKFGREDFYKFHPGGALGATLKSEGK